MMIITSAMSCDLGWRKVFWVVMSTLAEIATAIRRLPPGEQEELLRQLQEMVNRHRGKPGAEAREQWMDRLDDLRARLHSGSQRLTTEQILTESREERA
jgi:hypothetical protein